jgi:hypothetical protein
VSRHQAVLLAALLAGCSASPALEAEGRVLSERSIAGPDRLAPGLRADGRTLAAADPSLPGFDGWPVTFLASVPASVDVACEIAVRRGSATLTTLVGALEGGLCTARWNGLASGAPATVGPIAFEARLVRPDGAIAATASQAGEVLRLGVERIDVDGDRHPLLYRKLGGRRDGWSELPASESPFAMAPDRGEAGASALELPGGARRPTPAPWNDVLSPPTDPGSPDGRERDTYDLPFALVAGSDATLRARLATAAAGGASGDPIDTEVRLVAPSGFALSGEDRVAHGNVVTLEPATPLAPAVGRYDVPVRFRFEARRLGGDWQPVPGQLEITLRAYGLVAAPVFYGTSIPHRTWVDVIDRIAEWVGGASADPDAVGARLVEGIFYESGLRYDTVRGASFYTSYGGSGFSAASFEMQAFEERDYGTIINCSDAASILSSYANMVGLDFRYHILTHRSASGFDLNFIQAIGVGRFDDTPFDSGRGGFSYHAIVGARDGRTWDATLAVDGDGAPAATPHTLLLVQGLGAMDYLDALSSEAVNIATTRDDRVRIR